MKVSLFSSWIYLAVIVSTESLPEGIREGPSYDGVLSSSESIGVESLNSPSEISKFVNLGLGSELDSDVPRRSLSSRKDRLLDPEVADQLEGNGWLDVIPGTPGKDYPNYRDIPQTSFTCEKKTAGGYYADIEARCQVFHVCNTNGEKSSFMCPSGSIFNQKYFVCDWWYDFECDDATDLYSLNEKLNRGGTGSGPSGPGRISIDNFAEELRGIDLSSAGTGEGNIGYGRGKNGYNESDDDTNEKRSDEREKSALGVKGEGNNNDNENEYGKEGNKGAEKRRSESTNRASERSNEEGRIRIENQRGDNYESRGEGSEGGFWRGNDRRRDHEFRNSAGFKEEYPERRVDEEINTRRVDSRINKNRNRFRDNNYSSGDYLLGVVMEDVDDDDDGNRSSPPRNTVQRRRFLPIL